MFEVGCATGELYRYIHNYRRDLDYKGFDISEPAIERAKQKYPDGDFHKLISELDEIVESFGQPEAVWCRDVVLHQKDPYLFLDKLIDLAKEALFIRLRTRDVGDTEFNSNISCQLHWDKYWVPYIVLNVDELISRIEENKNIKLLVIHRAYDVLGGYNHRLLPEELYFSSTGTAETGESIIESAITSGQISYDITCGTISHFAPNGDDNNVTVIVDGSNDGVLTITLHEEIIKPFDDGDFFVVVNGEETDFLQNGNNLTIPCDGGTEIIEIYGSWAIPEFGVIAGVILAVAIASIIAVSAKSRLTLVPKN